MTAEPSRMELLVQAAWFAGCFVAPVVVYRLVVGVLGLLARVVPVRRGRRVA